MPVKFFSFIYPDVKICDYFISGGQLKDFKRLIDTRKHNLTLN